MTDTPDECLDRTASAAPTVPTVPAAATVAAAPAGFLTKARNAFASLFDDGPSPEPIGSADSAAADDVH